MVKLQNDNYMSSKMWRCDWRGCSSVFRGTLDLLPTQTWICPTVSPYIPTYLPTYQPTLPTYPSLPTYLHAYPTLPLLRSGSSIVPFENLPFVAMGNQWTLDIFVSHCCQRYNSYQWSLTLVPLTKMVLPMVYPLLVWLSIRQPHQKWIYCTSCTSIPFILSILIKCLQKSIFGGYHLWQLLAITEWIILGLTLLQISSGL